MIKVSLIITEEIEDMEQFAYQISMLDIKNLQLQLVLVSHKALASSDLNKLNKLQNIDLQYMIYPEDDELLLGELLKLMSGEYFINYLVQQSYPANFLQNTINKKEKEESLDASLRDPFVQRVLKAVQQSKYGMGILKQDIKRAYPEIKLSLAYLVSDFTKLKLLQLEVSEKLAAELYPLADKMELSTKKYIPDYSAIKYYTNTQDYFKAVRKGAALLSFRNNPNTVGFPFYMMIFMILSLLMSLFLPKAILPLIVVSGFYFLTITLETLAISTIKKQGDILLGLMFFFPFLHIYYFIAFLVKSLSKK